MSVERLGEAVARLRTFPLLGAAGTVAGTRELIPHPTYRVVCQVEGEAVWVLALVHTARQWPPERRSTISLFLPSLSASLIASGAYRYRDQAGSQQWLGGATPTLQEILLFFLACTGDVVLDAVT